VATEQWLGREEVRDEASTENISIGTPLGGVVAEVSVIAGQAVRACEPLRSTAEFMGDGVGDEGTAADANGRSMRSTSASVKSRISRTLLPSSAGCRATSLRRRAARPRAGS
jgi:hypothetical protein